MSSESVAEIEINNNEKKQYNKIKVINRNNKSYYNYHIGVFTFNFVNIVKDFGITNIKNNYIWKDIEFISKQTFIIKGNIKLIEDIF